jgi:Tripartite tricarboxylate transporter family receptor
MQPGKGNARRQGRAMKNNGNRGKHSMASRHQKSIHSRRSVLRLGAAAALMPMAPAILRAQATDLPSGPIRIILPTASGGQADTLGRLIGDKVGAAIDRSFVMEPRAGAGGLIAGEYVARAAPDGNTLLFVTGGQTILPGLYAKTIKFDAVKDFAFVCQISSRVLSSPSAPTIRRSRSPTCWSARRRSPPNTRSAAPALDRPST